jgi:hypothetical protein
MKKFLLLLITGFMSILVSAQTSQDREMIKKVIKDFQNDFNDGTFKNAVGYTTKDWEHINPGGGIDKRP